MYKDIVNPQILWEVCKCNIKSAAIRYSKKKARNRFNDIQKLEMKMQQAQKDLSNNPDSLSVRGTYDTICREHELKTAVLAKGAQIRSRVKFIEEGEKKYSIFLSTRKKSCPNESDR